MKMKAKPNVDDFLEAGAGQTSPKLVSEGGDTHGVTEIEARKPKTVYLPNSVLSALKRRATEQTIESGQRVTETDLIEEALRKYLNK